MLKDRDTTSRGLCARVRPPHTIARRGGGGGCEQGGWRGGEGAQGRRSDNATSVDVEIDLHGGSQTDFALQAIVLVECRAVATKAK